jgi:hypothetical protein
VRALAVHGFSLDDHAVVRAGVLGGAPMSDSDAPEALGAYARVRGAVAFRAGFNDQMPARLAVDSDVVGRNIEATEFESEDRVRRLSFQPDAGGWHRTSRWWARHAPTGYRGYMRRARDRQSEAIRGGGAVIAQHRRGRGETHA